MSATLLQMHGIIKRYPGVLANDGIDLDVGRGEVHAVMGENGAGKSTLMAILFGLQRPDAGSIVLDGQTIRLASPLDAIRHGIGMVHQGFRLFEQLTVWENVVYRSEPRRGPLVDRAAACRRVEELSARHGLPIDPRARVADLPVGVRQRLEILKALYRNARLLILDEPTAVLTPSEIDGLFEVIASLAGQGCAVLLVTHKLDEVMRASRRVTVLRDGRVAARLTTAHTDAAEIVQAMTGRRLLPPPARMPRPAGAPRLAAQRLRVRRTVGPPLDLGSLQVCGGEIVGVAGVAGNGQSELVEVLVGLRPCAGGSILLDGVAIDRFGIAARRRAGVSYIAEDRQRTATAADVGAQDNLAMGFHRRPPLARGPLLRPAQMRLWAERLVARFGIRIAHVAVKVGTLSGGNLQKVVVAREMAGAGGLLIAEQPTRGVDVGAIEFIHAELRRARDAGRAILLVSSELSELRALSDRILVMYAGRIVAERAGDADEQSIGLLMAGVGAAGSSPPVA